MNLCAAIASLLLLALATTLACTTSAPTQEALKAEVVSALDALAAELAASRPTDAATYVERLHAYLDAYPAFYGSAVALLDQDGKVTASPYVYRTTDGYATLDLAVPSYNIELQDWVTAPLAANEGVWTAPYFDAGAERSGWLPASFQCGMPRASLRSLAPIFPWKTPASNACTASTPLPFSSTARCWLPARRCDELRVIRRPVDGPTAEVRGC